MNKSQARDAHLLSNACIVIAYVKHASTLSGATCDCQTLLTLLIPSSASLACKLHS